MHVHLLASCFAPPFSKESGLDEVDPKIGATDRSAQRNKKVQNLTHAGQQSLMDRPGILRSRSSKAVCHADIDDVDFGEVRAREGMGFCPISSHGPDTSATRIAPCAVQSYVLTLIPTCALPAQIGLIPLPDAHAASSSHPFEPDGEPLECMILGRERAVTAPLIRLPRSPTKLFATPDESTGRLGSPGAVFASPAAEEHELEVARASRRSEQVCETDMICLRTHTASARPTSSERATSASHTPAPSFSANSIGARPAPVSAGKGGGVSAVLGRQGRHAGQLRTDDAAGANQSRSPASYGGGAGSPPPVHTRAGSLWGAGLQHRALAQSEGDGVGWGVVAWARWATMG